jgi:hypothetical protein
MSAQSDVKLVPGQVIVDALDLCLDSPDRRKEQTNPHRRALVHDFDDGLTLNWDHDYPGGVKINHLREIHAKPKKTMTSPGAVHLAITGNTRSMGSLQLLATQRSQAHWMLRERSMVI